MSRGTQKTAKAGDRIGVGHGGELILIQLSDFGMKRMQGQ
jgi:hypothetical protein